MGTQLLDIDAETIVLGDGAELLVHDGRTEAPLWRHALDAPIVGVGLTERGVVAVAASGTCVLYDREGHELRREQTIRVLACAMNRAGDLVVANEFEVLRVDTGETYPVAGVVSLAVAADGAIAAGTEGGLVHIAVAGAREVTRIVDCGAPVASLTAVRSGEGGWFAGVDDRLVQIEKDGSDAALLTSAPDRLAIDHVCTSPDGTRVGFSLGRRIALVMNLPSRETAGNVTYGDREVTGLAFSDRSWIGVGLDGGDGNRIDVDTGAVHRTDTHPGREHRRWVLLADVGPRSVAPPAAPQTPEANASRPAPGKRGAPLLGLVGTLLGLILGGAIAYLGSEALVNEARLSMNGVTTMGRVLDHRVMQGSRSGRSYEVLYEFAVDGTKFTHEDETGRTGLWIALADETTWRQAVQRRQVEVLYLPSDPRVNRTTQGTGARTGGDQLAGLGLGLCIFVPSLLVFLSLLWEWVRPGREQPALA